VSITSQENSVFGMFIIALEISDVPQMSCACQTLAILLAGGSIQGGHSSGTPGKVRELKSGQGKVRENRKSQGK